MAATEKAVLVTLETIKWKEITVASGGGGEERPSLSPYLWTIFFKVDGTSVMMSDTYYLFGTADVEPARGGHGDLGVWSMSVGETVAIPDELGFWSTSLKPFFIALSAQPFFDNPGVPQPQAGFGCIAILLRDGGHIPAHAVEAGRQALASSLQTFLDGQLVERLGVVQPTIPAGDLAQAQANISKAVSEAMINSLSLLEKVWALSGYDEPIATWRIIKNAASPSKSEVIPAGDAFSKFGKWELSVNVTITDPCPAEAVETLIRAAFGGEAAAAEPVGAGPSSPSSPLGAMREFRDSGGLRDRPGLRLWWQEARANTAEMVRLLASDKKLRSAAATVMRAIPAALGALAKPLPKDIAKALDVLLQRFEAKGSPKLKRAVLSARREWAGGACLPVNEILDRFGRVETKGSEQRSDGQHSTQQLH
jgi:hypothetical protein